MSNKLDSIILLKFGDLPEDWKCPLCGAPKSLFEEVIEEQKIQESEDKEDKNEIEEDNEDLRELSNYEISLICSNLARGCEKQYLEDEEKLFRELAKHYEEKEQSKAGTLNKVKDKITEDISKLSNAMNVADKYHDRGAKRVITWATKTSNIMKYIYVRSK